MPATIVETYPTLWHYTTAAGLEGILKSQQLWATNIRYLNDDEEFRGFFERKLPTLLKTGINSGITNLESSRLKDMLKIAGDIDGIKHTFFEALHTALKTVTLQHEAYITSFCYTPSGADSEDGLLSQWRGYGHDGGYAIVLDTTDLNELIKREHEQYKYPFLNFSDVDYHYENWVNDSNRYEETIAWERIVQEKVSQMVVDSDFIKHAEDIFIPILSLAIRHKHHGFKE